MPSPTDAQIERITAAIRDLCRGPMIAEAEAELRKLAEELRIAISRHTGLAKSSLQAKKAAILDRDSRKDHAPGKIIGARAAI